MYILYRYKRVPTASVFIIQRLKYYNCYKYFLGLYGVEGTRLHEYDIGIIAVGDSVRSIYAW